jgi:hypothetical protein
LNQKFIFFVQTLSPLLENPKRCFASFEDPDCGAPPKGELKKQFIDTLKKLALWGEFF